MVTGAALAVGGAVWANVILEAVLDASHGTLDITDHLQAQLVTWEVTALAMLVGSGLAGVLVALVAAAVVYHRTARRLVAKLL
jgi:hypothetical protein